MRFFFTKDEWHKSVFDNLHIFGNKTGFGWTDKIWHYQSNILLVIVSVLWFHWSIFHGALFALICSILWELIVDCNITKDGISKFDLIADLLGIIEGVGILLIWKLIGM